MHWQASTAALRKTAVASAREGTRSPKAAHPTQRSPLQQRVPIRALGALAPPPLLPQSACEALLREGGLQPLRLQQRAQPRHLAPEEGQSRGVGPPYRHQAQQPRNQQPPRLQCRLVCRSIAWAVRSNTCLLGVCDCVSRPAIPPPAAGAAPAPSKLPAAPAARKWRPAQRPTCGKRAQSQQRRCRPVSRSRGADQHGQTLSERMSDALGAGRARHGGHAASEARTHRSSCSACLACAAARRSVRWCERLSTLVSAAASSSNRSSMASSSSGGPGTGVRRAD